MTMTCRNQHKSTQMNKFRLAYNTIRHGTIRCTKGDNRANGFTFSHRRLTPLTLGHICRLSRDTHQLLKHYIYPLMPSPAHLLPLTGSTYWAVHGELGFNWWKMIWVNPSGLSIRNPGPLDVEIGTTLSW